MDRGVWAGTVRGVTESDMTVRLNKGIDNLLSRLKSELNNVVLSSSTNRALPLQM